MEIWKDVKGYEGIYQVSDSGRVKSLGRQVPHATYGKQTIKERLMSLVPTKCGYLRATFKRGPSGKFLAHRLVAEAFIPNPENKPQVNHKDGNKQNNHWSNLEWVTCSENIEHSYRIKLRSGNGEKNNFSKLSDSIVNEIRNGHAGLNQSEIAKIYGVSKSVISSVRKRRSWKHI